MSNLQQLIPRRALLVCGDFSARLRAPAVAAALARGMREADAPEPDVVLLGRDDAAYLAQRLAELGFDERMRAARAVVLAVAELDPHSLARAPAFEVATRARQAGVPAYAVAGESRLDSFDARVLDLQLVLQARSAPALTAAGRRLAEVI
jgi:hypothetical protein